jgi:hypothetical protein
MNESYADLLFKSLAHSTKDYHETFLPYIGFLVTDIPEDNFKQAFAV